MVGILGEARAILSSIYGFYEVIGNWVYEFFVNYSRLILDQMHIMFNSIFYILLFVTIVFTTAYFLIGIYLMLSRKKKEETPAPESKLPFVTIQIPTYNELAALNCAKRCLKFDYPKDKYDIVIGDDSSDKSVSARIDEFARAHKSVKVTRRGSNIGFKPGNLNYMLKFTKGDYIVIFDSDFLPEEDFLKRIMTPFIYNPKVSAVQARWITKNFSKNLTSVIGGAVPLLTHFLGLPFLNRIDGNRFIAGSAEAIKKSDLIKLGGWKGGSLTEDIEYSLRLAKVGKRIEYLEDLHCECEAPFTLKDLCKQQMRWAHGVISALKLHFWDIVSDMRISLKDKVNTFLLLSGYITTLLFFSLAVSGSLSIITHRPDIINWSKFISETTLNVILTSGFFMTSLMIAVLGKRTRDVPKLVIASFSVGLIVIFVVSYGIAKAIFNRPITWFMLKKEGNMYEA